METSQHLGDTGTFALTRGDDTDTHPALRTKLRRASMPSPDPVLNNNTFARPASVPSPEVRLAAGGGSPEALAFPPRFLACRNLYRNDMRAPHRSPPANDAGGLDTGYSK